MALPDFTPQIPSLPNIGIGPISDAAAKDEKVRLSELLRRNGWGGKDSPLNRQARGVIQCESRGDTNAYNNSPCAPGENAVGFMQVCTVHRGTMGIPKDKGKAVEFLKVGDNNVRVGRSLHRRNGWQPWACPATATDWDPEVTVRKRTAVGEIGGVVDEAVDAVVSPLEAVGDFVGMLGQSSTWFRVGKVVIGGVFVIIGVGALVASGGRTIARATPAGRLARKVVK